MNNAQPQRIKLENRFHTLARISERADGGVLHFRGKRYRLGSSGDRNTYIAHALDTLSVVHGNEPYVFEVFRNRVRVDYITGLLAPAPIESPARVRRVVNADTYSAWLHGVLYRDWHAARLTQRANNVASVAIALSLHLTDSRELFEKYCEPATYQRLKKCHLADYFGPNDSRRPALAKTDAGRLAAHLNRCGQRWYGVRSRR